MALHTISMITLLIMLLLLLIVVPGLAKAAHRRAQDNNLEPGLLENRNPHHLHQHSNYTADKNDTLQVFVAITSGPQHGHLRHASRNTWLLPCKYSSLCDYRYFIDIPDSLITSAFSIEVTTHQDIITRAVCPLMSRHFDAVNYGNSPPTKDNDLHIDGANDDEYTLIRIFYKIDWKVCFMRWMVQQKHVALMNVFVEDDSFICMDNLLYQADLFSRIQPPAGQPRFEFRTGTKMYDGFDDSSTIMSAGIVEAFARDYPDRLKCHSIYKEVESKSRKAVDFMWLSWGNSWMSRNCNWKAELAQSENLAVNFPDINCLSGGGLYSARLNITGEDIIRYQSLSIKADEEMEKQREEGQAKNITSITNMSAVFMTAVQFPCRSRPLILHHAFAGDVLLHEAADDREVRHTCEAMLLIDKIKDVAVMFSLWNRMYENNFYNFSLVWTKDRLDGWADQLEAYKHDIHGSAYEYRRSLRRGHSNWKAEIEILEVDSYSTFLESVLDARHGF